MKKKKEEPNKELEKPMIDMEKENKKRKEEWDKFARNVIPKLKKLGYLETESSYSALGIVFGILIFLIVAGGVGAFIYFGFTGYFAPIVTDNSTCLNSCPEIPPAPSCPTCSCPAPNVNVTFTMPKDLSINVVEINITNGSI